MKYGLFRVAAVSPKITVNKPSDNARAVLTALEQCAADGAEIVVMPELCLSGYTAADLFYSNTLLDGCIAAIKTVAANMPTNMLAFVGAPIAADGRLYNCAVALARGRVLGVVPKTELPEYAEFYEKRYFTPAFDAVKRCAALDAPMGNVLFRCENYANLTVGCEICEDMWADVSPSVEACRAGATLIVNLSASSEVVGKAEYRKLLVESVSGRLRCCYAYADAGEGESSTDVVFSAHNLIAENGSVLDESKPFGKGYAIADIDVERIDCERRKTGLKQPVKTFEYVPFSLDTSVAPKAPMRTLDKYPFVPSGDDKAERAELILTMQSRALKSRFDKTHSRAAVIGVSGGLDSALALLVCNRAVGAEATAPITMPCFGTSEKTLENARLLCRALGMKLDRIDIANTVTSHLGDISHTSRDVVYENAQARVRTLTLFDTANKLNGLVVGTGDLSELALGFATYNGDHMSSYGVNAGVPKTLVKTLIAYEADRLGGETKSALERILGTEISPELLPPEDGKIAQKTEDILGKYDLLDFIIYYYARFMFSREKIEYLLTCAYADADKTQIDKALDTFYKRFHAAQFKRSCMPDGVKIGSVSFSPRSDFRLPSDI